MKALAGRSSIIAETVGGRCVWLRGQVGPF